MLLYTATSNVCNTGPLAGVLGLLQGIEKSLLERSLYSRVLSTIPLQEARAEKKTCRGALPSGGGQKT